MLLPAFRFTPITADDVATRLQNKEYFSFCKLLHGYWERLYKFSAGEPTLANIKTGLVDICKNNPEFYKGFVDKAPQDREGTKQLFNGFDKKDIEWHYVELIDMMREESKTMWGVYYDGYPKNSPLPVEKKWESIAAMKAVLPPDKTIYNGMCWKQWCVDGSMMKILNAMRKYFVVVVGMSHLNEINAHECWQFPQYQFYRVRMPLSIYKNEFIMDMVRYHKQFTHYPVVYLFQGGYVGAWAIHKLSSMLSNAFFLDVGKSLDIFCNPSVMPFTPFASHIDWNLWRH